MWRKLERQVQAFLQPLAEAGLFGPPAEPGAFQVICDERLNGVDEIAARTRQPARLAAQLPARHLLVVRGHARPRARRSPPGALHRAAGGRAHEPPADERKEATDETERQRNVSQALFDYYQEPRHPQSWSATAGP